MGKAMRNFVVTKQLDSEDHVEEEDEDHLEDEEAGMSYQEPSSSKARYITRTLFVFLLITGATLIGSGVTLLVTCRNKVTEHTCEIALFTEPCSDLAVSAYFGCILILATIFGFGCVGRKAMAAILVPLVIGEMVLAIYMLTVQRSSEEAAVLADLATKQSLCFAATGNTSTTKPIDLFMCWKDQTSNMRSCQSLRDSSVFDCSTVAKPTTLNLSQESLMRNCSGEIASELSDTVWNKMLVAGPLLLVHAHLHLAVAICLWFLRRSNAFKRGLGLIPLKDLPLTIRSSPSKQNAKCGTCNQDQSHQSLIFKRQDAPPILDVHKYVFKKLRRQKNTYATV